MAGLVMIELAHAAEEERMREAMTARVRAQARRENRRRRGPGRTARAWAAFWAPREMVVVSHSRADDAPSADLATCADC
jgi:hypothetical protein